MNDDVSKLLRAVRPLEFEPGTTIDPATREWELAKAFGSSYAVGVGDVAGSVARRRRRVVAVRAVAAIAAVCLVAVGVWAAGVGQTERPAAPKPVKTVATRPGTWPGTPPIGLLDAPVAEPLNATSADAGMPPYYVVADHMRPVVDIRSSATGKILSSVPLPAGADPKLSHVAAAGNDRTFVLALFTLPGTTFYVLRVGEGGRSAQLSALPVPAAALGKFVMAIAVSQDGTRLAIAIQLPGGQRSAIQVITLHTGALRTWTTRRAGLVTQLSWAGRELGFFWQDTGPSPVTGGLWVLNTARPGSNLLSGRRILPDSVGDDTVQSAVLSPDGKSIDASVTYSGISQVRRGTVVGGIVEVSAHTRRPLRTLLAEHAARSGDPESPGWYITTCQLLGGDGSGNHLLVSCDRLGRLDRGRFTALPGSPPQTVVATAW